VTLLGRIVRLTTRRLRARRLGCHFPRARDFRLPAQLLIGGRPQPVSLPEQDGVRDAFIAILLDDCYGLRHTSDVTTILDIGANVGVFGLAARIAYPGAVIHAYEPNGALEPHLRRQADSARFAYFLEAVGAQSGRVVLEHGKEPIQTRSSPADDGSVPQVAFREAIRRLGGRADLVKVDCEGAEWSFIEDEESWRNVRFLSMEYHLWPSHTVEEISGHVRGLGFRIDHMDRANESYGLLLASRR
jgi:FkbM family methyltransferase